MTQIDDDGLVNLFAGVRRQAVKDIVDGDDPKAAVDAAEYLADLLAGKRDADMPEWYRNAKADQLTQEIRAAQAKPKAAPKAQPATSQSVTQPSPFEGLTPERLDAWGVSTQWANMSSQQLAELERKQAHRDRAARLGVDWRYLPPMED